MPTCEGCNRSSKNILTSELCEECVDKAARFDLCLFERNQLLTAAKKAAQELGYAQETKDAGLRLTFLSQAKGRLGVVVGYCEG